MPAIRHNRMLTQFDLAPSPWPGSSAERESLRWPPNLEHAEIIRRLAEIRDFGPPSTTAYFADVEKMSPARIAVAVLAGLAWLNDHDGDEAMTHRLLILALNLKNLD